MNSFKQEVSKYSKRCGFFLAWLLFLAVILPAVSRAGEVADKTDSRLPATFNVSALRIDITCQNGNANYSPWRIQLSGKWGGKLFHKARQQNFAYSDKQLISLFNQLNEIHFFSLPTQYAPYPVAGLGSDGRVRMAFNITSSASSNSLCVSVSSYKKCVYYGANRIPVALDKIVHRVFKQVKAVTDVH